MGSSPPFRRIGVALDAVGTGIAVPQLAVVADGDRRVLQVVGWSEASEIPGGGYLGPDGLTPDIAAAADLRGPATITSLGSMQDPGAPLTIDPVSGDVFQTTGG